MRGSTPLSISNSKHTIMANIMDLLASYEMVELVGSAWQNSRFAATLRMPVPQADRLLAKYGAGWIYTQSAIVLRDTPYNRGKVAKLGKTFVIVESDRVIIRSPKAVEMRRKSFDKSSKAIFRREQAEMRELLGVEREAREIEKKREKLFRECQGVAAPKRGGKGNSIADLGFYVGTPKNPSITKSEVRFMIINPKGGLK